MKEKKNQRSLKENIQYAMVMCSIGCSVVSILTLTKIMLLEEKLTTMEHPIEKMSENVFVPNFNFETLRIESSSISSSNILDEMMSDEEISFASYESNVDDDIQEEKTLYLEVYDTPITDVIQDDKYYTNNGVFEPSHLDADDFNYVINRALEYYGRTPEEYLAYGLGETFEYIETTYGMNALYIIAITHRESGFNTSDNAKVTNNLTSIMEGDRLKYYGSPSENLIDTARLLVDVYKSKKGLYDIYSIGNVYNPVNDTWAYKVQSSVDIFYKIINNEI